MATFLESLKGPRNHYKIFMLDDDRVFTKLIQRSLDKELPAKLSDKKFTIKTFNQPDRAFLDEVAKEKPEILILDYHIQTGGGKEVLGTTMFKEVKKVSPDTGVLMLTGEDRLQTALDLMKLGAYDYILKTESAAVNTLKAILRMVHVDDLTHSAARNKLLMRIFAAFWVITISAGIVIRMLTSTDW